MRRLGCADYHELHRVSVEEPERFWPELIDDLGLEFSQPWERVLDVTDGPEWAKWFVGGAAEHRVRTASTAGATCPGEAAVFRGEDGTRAALDWRELSRAGDAGRGGARRARRARGRPRRDLPADVPGGRGRVARVRAHRRRAGADLLRLRRAGDRGAARGLRGEGRHLRRLVLPPRQARRHAGDARAGERRRRDVLAWSRDERLAGARDEAARNARAAAGRLGGAVPARLHVGHDRPAEGRAARPGRLPRLDRARGRVPDRRERAATASSSPPTWAGSWGRGRSSAPARRRDGDLRGGRAGLAARPAVGDGRVGARDDARRLADARSAR